MYPDTFEVHDKYSPIIDYPSSSIPIYDVTQVSKNFPPEILSQNNTLNLKYHFCLQKFDLKSFQILLEELFVLMHLLYELQDVNSQRNYDFGVLDILFQITVASDAEF